MNVRLLGLTFLTLSTAAAASFPPSRAIMAYGLSLGIGSPTKDGDFEMEFTIDFVSGSGDEEDYEISVPVTAGMSATAKATAIKQALEDALTNDDGSTDSTVTQSGNVLTIAPGTSNGDGIEKVKVNEPTGQHVTFDRYPVPPPAQPTTATGIVELRGIVSGDSTEGPTASAFLSIGTAVGVETIDLSSAGEIDSVAEAGRSLYDALEDLNLDPTVLSPGMITFEFDEATDDYFTFHCTDQGLSLSVWLPDSQ